MTTVDGLWPTTEATGEAIVIKKQKIKNNAKVKTSEFNYITKNPPPPKVMTLLWKDFTQWVVTN